MKRTLKKRSKGSDVRILQHALNLRLHANGFPRIEVDGVFGDTTATALAVCKYILGFREQDVSNGIASVNAQRYFVQPARRPRSFKARTVWRKARKWYIVKRARARAIATRNGPKGAIREARRYIGVRDNRPNWDRRVLKFLRYSGIGPAAWCGVFVRWVVNVGGGGKLTPRVMWVPNIVHDAKARKHGFAGYVTSKPRPGDLAVIKGQWHVELYIGNGYTVGGNTSPDGRGSQGNGGGVYLRKRGLSAFEGFARPRY